MSMFGRLDYVLLAVAAVGVAALVVQSMPDIRRYLEIRSM
jgi:hypothetical protein